MGVSVSGPVVVLVVADLVGYHHYHLGFLHSADYCLGPHCLHRVSTEVEPCGWCVEHHPSY